MCLAFPVYYPRTSMSLCTTAPTFSKFEEFIENYVPLVTLYCTNNHRWKYWFPNHYDRNEYQDQFSQLSIYSSPELLTATLGLLEWNNEQLQALQESVYKNGLQFAICSSAENDQSIANQSLTNLVSYTSILQMQSGWNDWFKMVWKTGMKN